MLLLSAGKKPQQTPRHLCLPGNWPFDPWRRHSWLKTRERKRRRKPWQMREDTLVGTRGGTQIWYYDKNDFTVFLWTGAAGPSGEQRSLVLGFCAQILCLCAWVVQWVFSLYFWLLVDVLSPQLCPLLPHCLPVLGLPVFYLQQLDGVNRFVFWLIICQ